MDGAATDRLREQRRPRWLTATHRARIEQVLVAPGDHVEPNTVVAVLDNPDMDLLLLDAEQKLASAEIQVAESRRQLDAAQDQAGLDLAAAQEQGRLAKDSRIRLENLAANGIATESDLARAESRDREIDERARRLDERAARTQRERNAARAGHRARGIPAKDRGAAPARPGRAAPDEAPSRTPRRTAKARSRPRIRVRSSSMRSAICRSRSRASSCAPCRPASSRA